VWEDIREVEEGEPSGKKKLHATSDRWIGGSFVDGRKQNFSN
jgi:hypothetical protein